MNRIFKVIWSKTKHCFVVVSELAKNQRKCHSVNVKGKSALAAAVLLALTSFSFVGAPAAEANDLSKNNYFTAYNDDYFNQDGTKNSNWSKHNKANTVSGNIGAKGTGAIAAGMFAQAGQQTITIGNRNAGMSMGSVFVGEYDHKQYDNPNGNTPQGLGNYYVTAVGFMSNATKYGTIAIGANASAVGEENNVNFGEKDSTGTLTISLPENPTIKGASVALGYSAKAKAGNIAIGSYSDATDTSSATPYVSIGSSTIKRRITNVADGTETTDVATVGQLQKAIESVGATGWKLSTGGDGTNATTINAGTTVDFSAAVDGKNGTTGHSNVTISNTDADGKPTSNIKIGLNKDIILGEASKGKGGSLNVYSDSTEASNLGNRVSIDGSTVSVNYGKEDGTSGTKRGVVLGVGEDYNNEAQGYIAFNNIDAKGTIGSTYLHSATDAPDNLKGRLVYSNTMSGTEYIANLDDGITFAGDVNDTVPEGYTQTPTKLNTTLNITGGAKTADDLTSGNIGVVSTPAAENADGTKTQASKLEIKLNKDLKGITSITSQTETAATGGKIELGANGTTISGGKVNVSNNKVTGLAEGDVNDTSTDAITGKQLNRVQTTLNDKNHNIKYYSVNSMNAPTFGLNAYTNEKNDGASGRASLAAGFITHADGLASTVAGSYSGIYNNGTVSGTDFRGAAALSLGTANINRNMDTTKPYSGVANSLIGQANVTTDSNAAIILGAGNTVKDSYRTISNLNLSGDMTDALKEAVPGSGGQVMVMGGGNSVENAYMTQVTGVGNTVTGSGDAYDADKSSQLNYVEGFYTTLTNGKNDYLIGAHNTVTGDSTDTNKSNIVFGDNHTLTNTKNNVILGSLDAVDETTVSDVVSIGHNAKVTKEGGVAIGSGSEATTAAGVAGYDPTGATADTTAAWTSKKAAVSVGTADETRQITGVAAGKEETDAVNVAQLKKLGEAVQSNTEKGLAGKANVKADNIGANLKDANGKSASANDIKDNEDAWGTAIGTGKVAKENGQLVTGETVYDALHGGLDDIVIGHDGKDAKAGSIGLVGPKGKDGKDGLTTTIIKTETGAAGVDGKDGITRIVYGDKDDPDHKHTVATLEDGLKFKGDDGKEIAKNLNDTLEIVGGVTDSTKLTDNNIGVNKTDDGKLKIQLSQELNGITSIGNQKTEDGKTTGGRITFGTDSSINVNGGKITNVGNGVKIDGTGKYTVTEQNKTNAANIGDVQNIVNDAKKELTDSTKSSLNGKANVDASNIGTNLAADKQQDNLNKWGQAIGTGKVEANNSQLVTGMTVYDEVRPKKDGHYVKANQTTGENLSALDTKIGKLDNNGNYINKDDSISKNLSTLDTHVKQNEEKITTIKNTVDSLDQNAVKYDDSTKGKISLAGEGGTTISNVKDGKLSDSSTDAVNGKQLWQEQQDRKNMKDISDTGKTVIRNLAKGSVKVVDGKNTTVSEGTEGDAKTYAVNVEGKGTVTSGNTGLISGGTAYTELRPADGTYVKRSSTTAANLSALDTGLKNTSSLIHTNTSGDTIHIGETSKATKVDVSSTDANGNKNGRVVTGVVTDAKDANSAANVGYVNGVTSATTQQLYRDMDSAYSRLDNNINRAAAGANALAALHPLDYDPDDKLNFAAGFGHYHNANAAAVGAFYYPNERTMINVGFTMGNGDPGVNAGVSFRLGKGSIYNGVSKAAMAQTIHDQSVEIDNLKKENQEMKQQIQEILKKLNG